MIHELVNSDYKLNAYERPTQKPRRTNNHNFGTLRTDVAPMAAARVAYFIFFIYWWTLFAICSRSTQLVLLFCCSLLLLLLLLLLLPLLVQFVTDILLVRAFRILLHIYLYIYLRWIIVRRFINIFWKWPWKFECGTRTTWIYFVRSRRTFRLVSFRNKTDFVIFGEAKHSANDVDVHVVHAVSHITCENSYSSFFPLLLLLLLLFHSFGWFNFLLEFSQHFAFGICYQPSNRDSGSSIE